MESYRSDGDDLGKNNNKKQTGNCNTIKIKALKISIPDKLAAITTKIDRLQESVSFCNDTYDEFKTRLKLLITMENLNEMKISEIEKQETYSCPAQELV